jgi:inhibitor of KinA sporulation pathway (predicted exonuclease)
MIKRADRVVVFDLELTCWDTPVPPAGEEPEIIQIGWCLLDPVTGERFDRQHLMVRPAKSRISAYCTALTGITPTDVRRGNSLRDVCVRMTKMGLRQYACAGYGDDLGCLLEHCAKSGAESPLSDSYINVALLVQLASNTYKGVGLDKACKSLGFDPEGTAHRADWDAWNAARVLGALLRGAWSDAPVVCLRS